MNTTTALVTGGTGTLGRQVVPRLRTAGYLVRVLSRQPRAATDGVEHVTGDLTSGDGVEAAVAGTEVIVHCAGTNKGDDIKAQHLVEAAERVGCRHLVFISVVGADRVTVDSGVDRAAFGYFASKLAAERVISESAVPWTILRATQFHDLTLWTAQQMAKLPVIPVPARFCFQPVDTAEVAERLVELTLGAPAGLVDELGGPRAYPMADLVRSYLRARHLRRPLVSLWMPGKAAASIRAGANLAPEHAVGRRTWEEFLDEHVADTHVALAA